MTRQKDLKRVVRSRMRKTGESYTAARAQTLRKPTARKPAAVSGTQAPRDIVPPSRYAELAGMSDGAVRERTGKTWAEWVRALDRANAWSRSHREIAKHVHETYEGVTGWWAQMVTVSYERIKGLRDVGQRRGGTYDASKSRTFPVPVAVLYRAWSEKRRRAKWLPDEVRIRTSTKDRSMRIDWPDGTRVSVHFTRKAPSKSTVAVQHGKLASKSDVGHVKAIWADRLDALRDALA